jgi:hypothetical protein
MKCPAKMPFDQTDAASVCLDGLQDGTWLRSLEVTPEMIEAGMCEAREHSLGVPLGELVTETEPKRDSSLNSVDSEGSGSAGAPARNIWDDPLRLKLLEVTPEMVEAGLCEAREYNSGNPWKNL